MGKSGAFISFEGIDGCGKSTQISLVARAFEQAGSRVIVLREPGSTRIGEEIRSLLLNPLFAEMDDRCELLLYEAARAQLVSEVIKPALQEGLVVLCDRFFDSTSVYQGIVRGLGQQCVAHLNEIAVASCVPHLTILLDVEDVRETYARATRVATDRLEAAGLDFQVRVRDGFRQLAQAYPERIVSIDAGHSPEAVCQEIISRINEHYQLSLAMSFAVSPDGTDSSVDQCTDCAQAIVVSD